MTLDVAPAIDEYQGTTNHDLDGNGASSSLLWNPLLWVVLCTAGSAYQDLRAEWGGLYFHPYLVVSFLLVFRALKRLHYFPSQLGRPAMLFIGMFALVLIRDRNGLFYLLKMGAIVVTFVLVALSVRTRNDFFAGALGLGLCVTALSLKGMFRGLGAYGSINPIEGTQKNAFSLYYLPAFTICLQVILWPDIKLGKKLLLGGILITTSAAILLSTNRSGWIGAACAVILVVSASKNRARIFFILLALSSAGLFISWLIRHNTTDIAERDAYNTAQSDNMRLNLFTTAISQLQANPLIGVSPSRLRSALRAVPGVDLEAIDVHNLTGFLLGGFGIITFLAFCIFAFAMLRRPPNLPRDCDPEDLRLLSYRLSRNVFIVWLVRAQFQEDALFSPTFCIGIALCVGLCISLGLYRKKGATGPRAIDFAPPPSLKRV